MLYSGKTNSCHRVDSTEVVVENFDSFHNTPKKLADRELMLQGKWPSGGCEYCKMVEDAGGSSDRMFHKKIPNLVPPELDIDPTATNVSPRIVEVYFDNVCNLSCIYCHDGFSSKIERENIKFGRYENGGLIIDNQTTKTPNFEKLTEKFWEWMEVNYLTIRRFHILGGEPFYQSQFDDCLTFLDNHKNPELEFNVISNLMIKPDKFRDKISHIKKLVASRKIKRFEITASIDCWGDEQEYIRYGLNLSQWKENFEFLSNEKWITLNFNQTISCLSLHSTPDLIKYMNQLRAHRDIGHFFMTINNRSHLNPDIFGDAFSSELNDIIDIMPENTWQEKESKRLMRGTALQINNATRNDSEIRKLELFLDEMDRRRNGNWRETFPWLERNIKNVV